MGVLWGSLGVLRGAEVSGGVLGRAGGVPERFLEGPRGLGKGHFLFFRSEFVNSLMKYCCFQF